METPNGVSDMREKQSGTRTQLCMRDIDIIGKFEGFHIVSEFIFLGHAPKVWKWPSSASKKMVDISGIILMSNFYLPNFH